MKKVKDEAVHTIIKPLILLQCVNGKNKRAKERKGFSLVFLCNEETPLLIARVTAYDFVAPAAHNGMIVVVSKFLKLFY